MRSTTIGHTKQRVVRHVHNGILLIGVLLPAHTRRLKIPLLVSVVAIPGSFVNVRTPMLVDYGCCRGMAWYTTLRQFCYLPLVQQQEQQQAIVISGICFINVMIRWLMVHAVDPHALPSSFASVGDAGRCGAAAWL